MSAVSGSSLIGVAIACAGNVLISLALTVQKLAHRQIAEQHRSAQQEDVEPGSGSPTKRSQSREQDVGNRSTAASSTGELEVLLENGGLDHDAPPTIPVVIVPVDGRAVGVSMDGKGNDAIGALNSPQAIRLNSGDIEAGVRRSASEQEDDDGDVGDNSGPPEAAYLKSKLWWIGLAMISIGEGGNFLSYAFAPASVVAPLGTVALIANCIFAPLILQERFRPRELIGMGLAILGAVTVVYASKDTNPRLDPSELLTALSQLPFLVYTALNLVLLLALIPLSRSPKWGGRFPAIDVGICAIFGGFTVLSTKALASLLSTIFLAAFRYPISWGLVLVLIGTSVAQVRWLNMALAKFESKEVIPIQFVFFSLAAIIGSAVLYQEFRDVSLSRLVNFIFGISTTFLGVHLLTSLHQARTPAPSSPSTPQSTSRSSSPSSEPPSTGRTLLSPATTPYTPAPAYRAGPSRTSERSPLLIPSSYSTPAGSASALTPGPISPRQLQALSPSLRGFRLIKRNSTGEISTLGINPQAGILLLGASPAATSASRRGRERDRSRDPERDTGQSRAEREEQGGSGRRDRARSRSRPSSPHLPTAPHR